MDDDWKPSRKFFYMERKDKCFATNSKILTKIKKIWLAFESSRPARDAKEAKIGTSRMKSNHHIVTVILRIILLLNSIAQALRLDTDNWNISFRTVLCHHLAVWCWFVSYYTKYNKFSAFCAIPTSWKENPWFFCVFQVERDERIRELVDWKWCTRGDWSWMKE